MKIKILMFILNMLLLSNCVSKQEADIDDSELDLSQEEEVMLNQEVGDIEENILNETNQELSNEELASQEGDSENELNSNIDKNEEEQAIVEKNDDNLLENQMTEQEEASNKEQNLIASNQQQSDSQEVLEQEKDIEEVNNEQVANEKRVVEQNVENYSNIDSDVGEKISFQYVVSKGESLSKIAKKVYGDYKKWKFIFENNKDRLSKPELIFAGDILEIPIEGKASEEFASSYSSIRESNQNGGSEEYRVITHKVSKGESLSQIAKKYYGTAKVWRHVWFQCKNNMKGPNQVLAGQTLTIDLGYKKLFSY